MSGVIVAYLHGGEVAHSFMHSMMALTSWDLTHDQNMRGFLIEECGTGRVIEGRNSAARKFLASDAEWLLFVDADMGFEPDSLDQLLAVADPVERPIVGALCFGQRKGPPGHANSRHLEAVPTVYRWIDGEGSAGFAPAYDYPRDALVRADGTGAAFVLIHRTVLERLRQVFPYPREFFDDTIYKGRVFGEDLTFCKRATEAGFPIHVHTGVKTSHYKATYLEESTLGDLAHVPTYVVIPFKDRLDLTSRLMRDLERVGGWDGVFLMDNGSNLKTKNWLSSLKIPGVEVVDCDGWNIHEMWNRGMEMALRKSWRCNIAILNNDIRLGDDMLTKLAEPLRSDPLLAAVCPNYDGRDGSGVQYVDSICAGRYDGTGGLAGFAFMLKGESDYRFPTDMQWWYGDTDMLMSILRAGSKAGIVLDATVEHVEGGSQTGDWQDPEMAKVLAADRAVFESKWLRQGAA